MPNHATHLPLDKNPRGGTPKYFGAYFCTLQFVYNLIVIWVAFGKEIARVDISYVKYIFL